MTQALIWFLYVIVPVLGLVTTALLTYRAKRKEG